MSRRNGVEWFPMDTDAFIDDEKIDALLYDEDVEDGYAAFGRYMKIACRIYREGPAIQLDAQRERKLMRDLDTDKAGLVRLLSRLMDVGLLDRGLWESDRVLTSRGIQRRWCAAKKRKQLPSEMLGWSLLGNSRKISENLGESRENSGDFGEPEKVVPLEIEEEIEEEREEEDKRGSSSSGRKDVEKPAKTVESIPQEVYDGVPRCLIKPARRGKVFLDGEGKAHRTAYGALEARHSAKVGKRPDDFASLMSMCSRLCPGGCRASPDDVSRCHALMAKALDGFDPAKGSSPWPLMRKILTEDRGTADVPA